jgi:hypothetical protein
MELQVWQINGFNPILLNRIQFVEITHVTKALKGNISQLLRRIHVVSHRTQYWDPYYFTYI